MVRDSIPNLPHRHSFTDQSWRNKIKNADQVINTVFDWSSGQGPAATAIDLTNDFARGVIRIFDPLGFVENDEVVLLFEQELLVACQEFIVGNLDRRLVGGPQPLACRLTSLDRRNRNFGGPSFELPHPVCHERFGTNQQYLPRLLRTQ